MVDDLTENVLERKGCPLHYWEGGRKDRPLVVFTHGACVDHHTFDSQWPQIARDYRVLAWDMRGHGSSQPMGESFTVGLATEDLLAVLDRSGYKKAVFVGHSTGTYVSQEVAFRYPDIVSSLVIADGTCITWRRGLLERLMLRGAAAITPCFPFEMLKKSGLKLASRRREVREYTYRAYSRIAKRDFVTILRGVLQCAHYEPGYRITQPLLLVHGDDDRMGDIKKIAPLWAKREPDCQYAVISDARHFAIMDNPDLFNRLLLRFLRHNAP